MKLLRFSLYDALVLFVLFSLSSCCKRNGKPPAVDSGNSCPFHPQPLDLTETEIKEFLSPAFDTVRDYIASQVDEETRPGMSANIVYKNKIIWEGNFGQISKTNTTKPDGNTIYRIASISKIFPTLFLYKLWEQGLVELNDPVIKYAPNFDVGNTFGFNGQLTLHDLASQISGLPSFFPFDLLQRDYFAWNGTLEETLRRIRIEDSLIIEPRTTCYYSNKAYALLGHILARNFTTDGNFENWAQKHVADVLKLSNTGFILTDEIREKMATGYYATGAKAPLNNINWLSPAGNYFSSARDLAQLSMSLMDISERKILNRETLIQMLTPVQKCGYGYLANYTGSPWEIQTQQSYLITTKMGDIDGYSSTLAMIPELDFSFTVLMSGARPAYAPIARTVIDDFIPVLVDVLRKKSEPLLPAEVPSRYVGYYQIDKIQYWNITVSEDNTLRMTNPKVPSGDRFRTVGLSFISAGYFQLTILGGMFPCIIGSSNLDVQNGALVQFTNFTDGKYNQFNMPGLNIYGFKREN